MGTYYQKYKKPAFYLWKLQKLSLTEKAHIINFVIYSKLWYLETIMDLPKVIISKIDKFTFNYIYNGKLETIRRETLKLEPKYGLLIDGFYGTSTHVGHFMPKTVI